MRSAECGVHHQRTRLREGWVGSLVWGGVFQYCLPYPWVALVKARCRFISFVLPIYNFLNLYQEVVGFCKLP